MYSVTYTPDTSQTSNIRCGYLLRKLRELQLNSLEYVGLENFVESLANQSQGQDIILLPATEAHVPKQNKAQDFGGQGIHGV